MTEERREMRGEKRGERRKNREGRGKRCLEMRGYRRGNIGRFVKEYVPRTHEWKCVCVCVTHPLTVQKTFLHSAAR